MSAPATAPTTLSQEPNAMDFTEQAQAGETVPTTEQGQPPIVPFKERVIGVAKKTRGTLLAKPELKEHGEKILQGEASVHDIHEPPARTE
ncbi:hypothetical protein MKEN_00931500 [Mycena kentingensis (nom. inval.)]|nr:hypothetical protein MKEN_00931500 [Mycena kentingensis (nom. inval.)]